MMSDNETSFFGGDHCKKFKIVNRNLSTCIVPSEQIKKYRLTFEIYIVHTGKIIYSKIGNIVFLRA